MSQDFINLDQIAKDLRAETGLSFPKIREILVEINFQIGRGLKNTSKVRIHDFGLFYVLMRKSRSIVAINTKTKRLLLEKESIKFKASPILKHDVNGYKLAKKKEYSPKDYQPREKIPPPPVEPIFPRPKLPLDFAPTRMMERVSPDAIRAKIKNRLMDLGRKNEGAAPPSTSSIFDLSSTPSGRLFASLFKQIQSDGHDNIHFNLTDSETTDIYFGRPRRKLSRVPTSVIKNFLDQHLELVDFHIPQERFVKIYFSYKMNSSKWLEVYSLPTVDGASVYLKIRGE